MSSDVYSQSRVGDLYAGTIPLAIMAWIFVALRFYSRYMSTAKFWWDDWTILLAVVREALVLCKRETADVASSSWTPAWRLVIGSRSHMEERVVTHWLTGAR